MTGKELLETQEYEFLKINPHLGKNIKFLTYSGSHSYGTNIEGSDVDICGGVTSFSFPL